MVQNTVTNTGSVAAKLAVKSVPFSVQIALVPCVALHIYTRDVQRKKCLLLNHAPLSPGKNVVTAGQKRDWEQASFFQGTRDAFEVPPRKEKGDGRGNRLP